MKGLIAALGVGVVLLILFPVAGLVGGAYYAATAAAAAGMGTGAVWALGAAGAVGGFLLGKVALAVSLLTVAGTASIGAKLFKKIPSFPTEKEDFKPAPQKPAAVPEIKDTFDARASITLQKDLPAPKTLDFKNKGPKGPSA